MKSKIFAMLAIAVSSCGANAQKIKNADVPAAVKSSFEKLYPNVKDADWEKEDANYEVGFEINKQETSVVFDAAGKLLETEVEIKVSELPSGIAGYVAENYPGHKIKEASKITDANGKIMYEAEVGKSDLIFDSGGRFIREIKSEDKDEEDED